MTIVAAEQQTMNFYMNHGSDWIEPIARGLYAEIALIEEQHVTHYESLLDPLDSWLEKLGVPRVQRGLPVLVDAPAREPTERIKALWELHLNMELGQLQVACDFMRRYEGREPAEILPPALPDTPGHVRAQQGVRARGAGRRRSTCAPTALDYVPVDELPADHRYFTYQETVNAGGAPSEQVIDENRGQAGPRVPRRDRGRAPRSRPAPQPAGDRPAIEGDDHADPDPHRRQAPAPSPASHDPRRPRPACCCPSEQDAFLAGPASTARSSPTCSAT